MYAKKSLGQHFLNSKHVLEQIIAASNIKKNENILEIGPGTGILTEALLKAEAKVIAIEKDVRAYDILKEKFANQINSGQLKLILGDILELNEAFLYSLLALRNFSEAVFLFSYSFSIVANIPYYITGAILEKFLEHEPRPNRMVLLVQKEVADRIVAKNNKESVLSISVKAFGTPKIIAKVPPGAFTPPPTVDSAILSINNISGNLFTENSEQNTENVIKDFFKIVKTGFSHKRKYLIRNLEVILDKIELENTWTSLKLDPKIRAEDLAIKDWVSLSTQFKNSA